MVFSFRVNVRVRFLVILVRVDVMDTVRVKV